MGGCSFTPFFRLLEPNADGRNGWPGTFRFQPFGKEFFTLVTVKFVSISRATEVEASWIRCRVRSIRLCVPPLKDLISSRTQRLIVLSNSSAPCDDSAETPSCHINKGLLLRLSSADRTLTMRKGGVQKMLNEYCTSLNQYSMVNVNEYKPLNVNEYIP